MGYTNYLKRPETFDVADWKEICSFVASLTVFWWNELKENPDPEIEGFILDRILPLAENQAEVKWLMSNRADSRKIYVLSNIWQTSQHIHVPFNKNLNVDSLSIYRRSGDDLYITKLGDLYFFKTNRVDGIDRLINAVLCFFHRYVYGCIFLSDGFMLNLDEPKKMRYDEIWRRGHKLFIDWEKEYMVAEQIGAFKIGAPNRIRK